MSYHFSQALEAAFLEENSWDGEQSARLKSIPSAPDDSASGKMKDTFHRSPYGMMFVPFEESLGAALLTWFRGDFLAKTSALQTSTEKDSTANAPASGKSLPESLAKYDRATHSLRTAQTLLFEDSTELFVTLPRWGTIQNGALYLLPIPAHLTEERECGYWPTPKASAAGPDFAKINRSATEISLQTAVALWPTPCSSDHKGGGYAGC